MPMSRIFVVVLMVGAVAWLFVAHRDPYRTALPFGTDDLSSVQAQLDKLPAEDRALVIGYVTRSRGDVLPPSLADPDDPLTARTFAEAIELQRRFLERRAADAARAEAREQALDTARAPLRAALAIELVGRAIVPRGELLGQRPGSVAPDGRVAKTAIDDTPIAVTTYRLRNTSGRAIASFLAKVAVRWPGEPLMRVECSIEHADPLAPGESVEIRCGDTARAASSVEFIYVDTAESELALVWKPRSIRFADGTALNVPD